MIDPENIASAWVAKKCGYQEFRRATYKGPLDDALSPAALTISRSRR